MRCSLQRLWNDDGLMSQAGEKVFCGRSTLYALRGAFAAGKTERAIELLKHHTNRRLLGSHVPYPIEWGLREASRTLPPGALYTAGFYGRSVWHSPHWFSFFCHCPKLAEGMGQHAIEKHTRVRQRDRRLDGLMDEARPGAPRRVSAADGERALAMTPESAPKEATHLEYAFAGQSIGLEPQYGRPHLAGLCLATASQRNIQALQRPAIYR